MAIGAGTLSSLFKQLYSDYSKGKSSQEGRYKQGLGALTEAAGLFGPGYTAGMKKSGQAAIEQSAVGRGLSNTTRPAAMSVGMQNDLENMRLDKTSEALKNIASYTGNYRDPYATTPGNLTHLATGGFGNMLGQGQLQLSQAKFDESLRLANRGYDPFGRPTGGSGGGGGYSSGGGGYSSGGGFGGSSLPGSGYSSGEGKMTYWDQGSGRSSLAKTPQNAQSGQEPNGSLADSVFAKKDTPPAWTGNYRSWKKKMDEYNKRHGMSLSGY